MTLTEQIFCAGIVIAGGTGALMMGARAFDQVDAQTELMKQITVEQTRGPAFEIMAQMEAERKAKLGEVGK